MLSGNLCRAANRVAMYEETTKPCSGEKPTLLGPLECVCCLETHWHPAGRGLLFQSVDSCVNRLSVVMYDTMICFRHGQLGWLLSSSPLWSQVSQP